MDARTTAEKEYQREEETWGKSDIEDFVFERAFHEYLSPQLKVYRHFNMFEKNLDIGMTEVNIIIKNGFIKKKSVFMIQLLLNTDR